MAGPSHGACPLSWSIFSPQGPALSHHVGAVIRNRFYIHGGIDKKGSTKPLGKLYSMDLSSGLWSEVRASNSPTLSHHASLVIEDRYLLIVGGWNGQRRDTNVYVYDAQEECWLPMETTGFPPGGGLSSHAMALLADGDILVIGREGSARIQRRTGNVYRLQGSILRGKFTYVEHPTEPASRSGHTMHLMPSGFLCICGGRADEPLEGHRGFKPGEPMDKTTTIMDKIKGVCQKMTPVTAAKIPGGRKHHVSVAGSGAIFIHGGETFDGRSKDPVGEMIVVYVKPELVWYRLGTTASEGRAGHVCVIHEGNIYIHGGEGPKGIVYGTTYKLNV